MYSSGFRFFSSSHRALRSEVARLSSLSLTEHSQTTGVSGFFASACSHLLTWPVIIPLLHGKVTAVQFRASVFTVVVSFSDIAPCGSVWWTDRIWWGPGRRWKGQRWTECGWGSQRLSPSGHLGRTSTTDPVGSTASSRRWSRSRWRCSFSEFSFALWGCCSLNSVDVAHWRTLR